MNTKICSKCKIEKEESNFAIRETKKDGTIIYRTECKECIAKKQNERRLLKKVMTKDMKNKTNKPNEPNEQTGETMDRILKSTSKRISDSSKQMNLKKSNLISALVEWGLDKMIESKEARQEIMEKYMNIK